MLLRSIGAALLVVSVSLPAAAQSVVGKGKTGPAPDPVNLDITGLFQATVARVPQRAAQLCVRLTPLLEVPGRVQSD